MKKSILGPALSVMLLIDSCTMPSEKPVDTRWQDEKAIKTHIDKIFRAYIDKDSITVRITHAQGWHGFLTFSTVIVRGIEQYMAEATASGIFDKTNPWHLTGYKMIDYDIIFHDQTGIISYIAEMSWKSGKDTGSYRLRSVDIYGKQNGEWIQVASNINPYQAIK